MNLKRLALLSLLAIMLGLIYYYNLPQYLTLEQLKESRQTLDDWYQQNSWQMLGLYFLIYVLVTGLSIPGAAVLTLAGGALFGLLTGVIIISFASSIGATLAMLLARYFFRDWVDKRFSRQLKTINDGLQKDGVIYLLTLRLIPAFPFFLVNILMGLTRIRLATFFFVSQIGMLAGTIVYVNAGTELAKIDSLQSLFSPSLIASFTLLGLFPLFVKAIISRLKTAKIYKPYKKPSQYDHNLLVIGAGSGGLVSAYIAAAVRADVTLIEADKMGGDCLNRGCVPSKSLIRSARFAHDVNNAQQLGFHATTLNFDFAEIMQRIQMLISEIEPHDSVERYSDLGVKCISGYARLKTPWEVEVSGKSITARNIIIASGSRPRIPPVEGIDLVEYLTSDTLWDIRKQPQHLLVMGGGVIGCELAQCFARLGTRVSMVFRSEHLLKKEDPDFSRIIRAQFEKEGINVLSQHTPLRFEKTEHGDCLYCQHNDEEVIIHFDACLIATGRHANTSGFGLEDLDIQLTPGSTIEVNEYLQTRFPNIFAVGDVAGPFQFTHTAAHQAWYAAVNALFGRFKKFKVDYSVIPKVTFTDPEIATVGINESEAKRQNISYELSEFDISELDRAIVDSHAQGKIKVLTQTGNDRILGVSIISNHAGELIAEYVLAMRYKLGLNKILSTIHAYPTWAEANKYVAGVWKRAHAPEQLLKWVARYHQWSKS